MAVTPSSLSFSYKKGGDLPPARVVNYSHFANNTIFEGVPNWLDVLNKNNTSADVELSNEVNNLNPGVHSVTITVKSQLLKEDDDGRIYLDPFAPTTKVGSFTVVLNLTEPVVLTLLPDNLTFNYEFGGATPSAQTVNITSENSWTITENTNWLSISATSGSNNGSFQVSVIPIGLNAGTHTANITVNDGVTTKILPVSLIVSEPDTSSDYLYVTPVVLNFGYTISGIIPPTKRIEMNSSGSWTASSNQSWINLLATSGKSGVGTLDIGIHNLTGLTVGNHFATVSITTGNIVKNISITLSVYEFAQELLNDSTLYFSDDNNIIKVSSGRTDTHLQIKASTVFEGESFTIPYNNPFYKGSAQKRIGLEAKKVIGNRPFIGIGSTSLFNPYKPVLFNLEINEVGLFTTAITQTINIQNIAFTKGVTPSDKWMSDLSRTIYTTKKGIVLFSFLGDKYVPVNELKLTGAVSKTYSFSNSIEPFYTVMLPVSTLDVEVGDEFVITAKDVSVKVVIKPEYEEQSFIFWENKWGCWDCFEFTGEFIANSNFKETSFEYRKDYKTIENKVLEIKDKGSYKINTGALYSETAEVTLQKMLNATNMYLYKDNVLVKVKSTTKKLELYKTNSQLRAKTLTFENVEI